MGSIEPTLRILLWYYLVILLGQERQEMGSYFGSYDGIPCEVIAGTKT